MRQGQWLKTHIRVTNIGKERLRRTCEGLGWHADGSALFDPGITWTGVADTFKRTWMAEHDLAVLGGRLEDYRPAGKRCGGDVARGYVLEPGDFIEATVVGLPRYSLRGQPVPGGIFTITAGYQPDVGLDPLVIAPVSVSVTLAGGPVGYPSPGQLVDRALQSPGFIEFLEQYPDPAGWANTGASWWPGPRYPTQPRFDAGRAAPHGVLEVVLYTLGIGQPWVGGVVLDPWTGESYGAWFE